MSSSQMACSSHRCAWPCCLGCMLHKWCHADLSLQLSFSLDLQGSLEYSSRVCVTTANLAMPERICGKIHGCDLHLPWPQAYQFSNMATSAARMASAAGLWLAGLWLYGRYVQFDPGGQAVGRPCINCMQQLAYLARTEVVVCEHSMCLY